VIPIEDVKLIAVDVEKGKKKYIQITRSFTPPPASHI
jgi:hypothetical protein